MPLYWLIGIAVLVMFCLWLALQPKQGSRASNAPQDVQPPSSSKDNLSPQSWPSLEAEVQHLVAQGHRLLAIKRVREQTGWGLKKAKRYVETIPPLNNESITADADSSSLVPPPPDTLSTDQNAEIRKLVINGQKIAAIKQVRAETGWGLREAKEYVETLRLSGEVQDRPNDLVEPSAIDIETDSELLEHLRNHRKIAAIKRVRELMGGISLAEAKARVEEIMRSQR